MKGEGKVKGPAAPSTPRTSERNNDTLRAASSPASSTGSYASAGHMTRRLHQLTHTPSPKARPATRDARSAQLAGPSSAQSSPSANRGPRTSQQARQAARPSPVTSNTPTRGTGVGHPSPHLTEPGGGAQQPLPSLSQKLHGPLLPQSRDRLSPLRASTQSRDSSPLSRLAAAQGSNNHHFPYDAAPYSDPQRSTRSVSPSAQRAALGLVPSVRTARGASPLRGDTASPSTSLTMYGQEYIRVGVQGVNTDSTLRSPAPLSMWPHRSLSFAPASTTTSPHSVQADTVTATHSQLPPARSPRKQPSAPGFGSLREWVGTSSHLAGPGMSHLSGAMSHMSGPSRSVRDGSGRLHPAASVLSSVPSGGLGYPVHTHTHGGEGELSSAGYGYAYEDAHDGARASNIANNGGDKAGEPHVPLDAQGVRLTGPPLVLPVPPRPSQPGLPLPRENHYRQTYMNLAYAMDPHSTVSASGVHDLAACMELLNTTHAKLHTAMAQLSRGITDVDLNLSSSAPHSPRIPSHHSPHTSPTRRPNPTVPSVPSVPVPGASVDLARDEGLATVLQACLEREEFSRNQALRLIEDNMTLVTRMEELQAELLARQQQQHQHLLQPPPATAAFAAASSNIPAAAADKAASSAAAYSAQAAAGWLLELAAEVWPDTAATQSTVTISSPPSTAATEAAQAGVSDAAAQATFTSQPAVFAAAATPAQPLATPQTAQGTMPVASVQHEDVGVQVGSELGGVGEIAQQYGVSQLQPDMVEQQGLSQTGPPVQAEFHAGTGQQVPAPVGRALQQLVQGSQQGEPISELQSGTGQVVAPMQGPPQQLAQGSQQVESVSADQPVSVPKTTSSVKLAALRTHLAALHQMVVEHRLKVPTLDELMTQHEDTQEHEDVSPAKAVPESPDDTVVFGGRCTEDCAPQPHSDHTSPTHPHNTHHQPSPTHPHSPPHSHSHTNNSMAPPQHSRSPTHNNEQGVSGVLSGSGIVHDGVGMGMGRYVAMESSEGDSSPELRPRRGQRGHVGAAGLIAPQSVGSGTPSPVSAQSPTRTHSPPHTDSPPLAQPELRPWYKPGSGAVHGVGRGAGQAMQPLAVPGYQQQASDTLSPPTIRILPHVEPDTSTATHSPRFPPTAMQLPHADTMHGPTHSGQAHGADTSVSRCMPASLSGWGAQPTVQTSDMGGASGRDAARAVGGWGTHESALTPRGLGSALVVARTPRGHVGSGVGYAGATQPGTPRRLRLLQVSSFCVSLAICSSWARQSATTSRQHPPSIPHQHGKPEQPSRTQRHRESHANERAAHEHVGWPTVWLRVAGGVGLATGVALLVQGVLIVMDRLVLRPRRRQRKGVGQCVLAQGTKRDGRTDAACSVL